VGNLSRGERGKNRKGGEQWKDRRYKEKQEATDKGTAIILIGKNPT